MGKIVFTITLIIFSASFESLADTTLFKASFDCSKATSEIEKTICGSELLANADTELGLLYKSLISALSIEDKRFLKKEQLDWLAYRDKTCLNPKTNIACLQELYSTRLVAMKRWKASNCDRLYAKGDFRHAIENCTAVLKNDPQLAAAYYYRANAWLVLGDIGRAIEDYTAIIQLDPKDASAYNNRGIAWYSKGDYEQAIKDILNALSINPTADGALNNLAWIYATCPNAKFLDGKKAIKLAKRAISLGEMNDTFLAIVYHKTLAAAYAQDGDFKAALSTETSVITWLEYDGYKDMLAESKARLNNYKSMRPWRGKTDMIVKDVSAGLMIFRDPEL